MPMILLLPWYGDGFVGGCVCPNSSHRTREPVFWLVVDPARFLIQNLSKLAILTAQSYLYWQFPFSACLFTCSMASEPQGSGCVQPRGLLSIVWQKHLKISTLIYFTALCGSPLRLLLPLMAAASFFESTHGSLVIVWTGGEQDRRAVLTCDSSANAAFLEVGNKEVEDIHQEKISRNVWDNTDAIICEDSWVKVCRITAAIAIKISCLIFGTKDKKHWLFRKLMEKWWSFNLRTSKMSYFIHGGKSRGTREFSETSELIIISNSLSVHSKLRHGLCWSLMVCDWCLYNLWRGFPSCTQQILAEAHRS